jgi:ABC-type transporter Mla subunit MlaD
MYTKNAEFKAGIVVLVGLAVLLSLLWLAGGAESLFARTRTIHIRFEQSYAAPTKGDIVRMNGIEVGKVSEVSLETEIRRGADLTPEDRAKLGLKPGEDGVAREIYALALVKMPREQVVPDGSRAEITVDVTGGRQLDIIPGLSTRDLSDEDMRRKPLIATSSGSIADVARSVQAFVEKAKSLIDNGNLVLEDVRGAIATVQRQLSKIDLGTIQGNVAAGTEEMRRMFETARLRVDEIAQKLSDAATSVKGLTADGQAAVKQIDVDIRELLAALKEVANNLNAIVVRASPKVDAMLDDLGAAAKSAAALGRELEGIGPQLKAIFGGVGGDLDRVLEDLAIVGHNLADASEDIRAHPWKLLNKPDEKTIAYENLRDAMTNYVRAAEQVRRTTGDLALLASRTDLPAADHKQLLDQMAEKLKGDLLKYDETAQMMLKILQQSAGPTTPK